MQDTGGYFSVCFPNSCVKTTAFGFGCHTQRDIGNLEKGQSRTRIIMSLKITIFWKHQSVLGLFGQNGEN